MTMSSEDAINTENKECFFYFKYQMKLEFIPFIEQEIREFLEICSTKVYDPKHRTSILRVLQKRIKQIDHFYQRFWNDYRMQQVLTSRKLLIDFVKLHHSLLFISKDSDPRN